MLEKRKLFLGLDIQTIIILVLVIILVTQRCNTGFVTIPEPEIVTKTVTDTQYVPVKDTVYLQAPTLVGKPEIDTTWRDTLRLKDSSYDYLFNRYVELGNKYYSRHIYKQSFDIDTIGTATIIDTVISNKITGRSLSYDLTYPVITSTVTTVIKEPYKPRRQLYVGGSIWGNQSALVNGASVGLLYKDKKDRVFGANAGVFNNQVIYGVSSYWKIKIK